MQAWLADHPEFASGDAETHIRRWLGAFPSLARGMLGRALGVAGPRLLGLGDVGATRLAGFYESDFYRAMAPRFGERLAELRARWKGD